VLFPNLKSGGLQPQAVNDLKSIKGRIMIQLNSSILISDFPVELIHAVTADCEIEQILSLCRVSRHINAIASRVLYQNILLNQHGQPSDAFEPWWLGQIALLQ
jgi:hypothetical protein